MTPEEIKRLIEEGIAGSQVMVDGDGTHFEAIVVAEDFAGQSQVRRHQMVYAALGERMGGAIHALSMRTYTPEEWESARDLRVL